MKKKLFVILLSLAMIMTLMPLQVLANDTIDANANNQVNESEDYLSFTAKGGKANIKLVSNGKPKAMELVYSTDKQTWNDFVLGDGGGAIVQQNETILVKIKDGSKPIYPGESFFDHWRFDMSGVGKAEAGGNVMSLVSGEPSTATTIEQEYGFSGLFSNCTALTIAPKIPATTLATGCYYNMFAGCQSLETAPNLPAEKVASYCYESMFKECTGLTTAPELKATSLADYCYYGMFEGCTGLTTAPKLPATKLAYHCYSSMFSGCQELVNAPELPATNLEECCYNFMFENCTKLTSAPKLPADTLVYGCYSGMFQNCTELTTAPELLAKTLANDCYSEMFSGCKNLRRITVGFEKWRPSTGTDNWVGDVAEHGTFVCSEKLEQKFGPDNIPTGWNAGPLHNISKTNPEHGTITTEVYGDVVESAVEGNIVTLSCSFDQGYALGEWKVATQDGEEIEVNDNTFVMPDDDVTITATEVEVYATVTFESTGGIEVPPQSVQVGKVATKPADPTKEGYTFNGWFLTPEATGSGFDFENTPIIEDITLYADWIPNDTPTPVPVPPINPTNGNGTTNGINTGDNAMAILFAGLGLAAAGTAVILRKRAKNK